MIKKKYTLSTINLIHLSKIDTQYPELALILLKNRLQLNITKNYIHLTLLNPLFLEEKYNPSKKESKPNVMLAQNLNLIFIKLLINNLSI
jgi:hypothetical protein